MRTQWLWCHCRGFRHAASGLGFRVQLLWVVAEPQYSTFLQKGGNLLSGGCILRYIQIQKVKLAYFQQSPNKQPVLEGRQCPCQKRERVCVLILRSSAQSRLLTLQKSCQVHQHLLILPIKA